MTAKKKNPLKDLGAFLAHQEEESRITQPNQVADHDEFMEQAPTKVAEVNRPEKVKITEELTMDKLMVEMQARVSDGSLSREALYQLMIRLVAQMPTSDAKDKMLINTLLYLDNQDTWREAVTKYWKKH